MLLRKSIMTLALVCLVSLAFAQKKPLTHDVYDDWKSLTSTNISNDGVWAGYRVAPQVGDAVLTLRNLNTDKELTIDRVSRYQFSSNSQFVAAEVKPAYLETRELKLKKTSASKMPKDSLYIINLYSGDIKKVARVKNYQVRGESGDWIAWLHEKPLKQPKKEKKEEEVVEGKEVVETTKEKKKKRKTKKVKKTKEVITEEVVEGKEVEEDPRAKSKGTELILFNMTTGEEKSISGVMEYLLTENGKHLFYEFDKVDSLNPAGIFGINTESGQAFEISTGLTDYKKMTADENGSQLSFFASANEKDDDEKYFSLMHWAEGSSSAQIVADTTSAALPENWMVSDNSRIRFSESGKRLYFGSAPRPMSYEYEEDTTLLKDDRPDVDVWSYNDPYIQPMQQLQSGREKNRTYEMVLNTETGDLTQLGGPDLQSIIIDTRNDRDFVLAMDDQSYRTQMTWDTQIPRDYYSIDVNSGDVDVIVRGAKGRPSLSPEGNYLTWFDIEDGHWYMMSMATKEVKNITDGMDVSFANELHDSPSLANGYGSAGWSEGDKAFYIYDRYDIWKMDPNAAAPVNVTNGYGRANRITLRQQRLEYESQAIETTSPIILRAFNEWTKASGFMTANLETVSNPTLIVMKDMSLSGLVKAKDADRVLVRMSTYEEYGELYAANSVQMDGLEKLSNVGAQEEPYKWGTNELVEFESGYDGEVMQAILYKPENFDENKKYPMIVYFYERRSNSLHSHPSPAPSASTVNIPYYVSNDYLVLVPDIKYELGHPGKSAMDHVIPATNAVVDMGFVDKDKMAIQGQSWGGYQVAHIVTRTDMYAAAGAGAPVANMTSAYGGVRWGSGMSRMFQYEKTQSRIGGTLWDEQDLYIENSPLFHVPNIETPLFIMHNDADGAVPWYQGIEFYMSLRRLQKPAWMVVYNGEAHNLRKRKNRKDLSVRMGQFFDHYLKGEPMPEWMAYGLPATLKGRTLRYDLVEESQEKVEEGSSLKLEKTKGQNN